MSFRRNTVFKLRELVHSSLFTDTVWQHFRLRFLIVPYYATSQKSIT